MEFYIAAGFTHKWEFYVSIPNGMEFYERAIRCFKKKDKFQFPTGWNSTHLCDPAPRGAKVSIPNGMKFYDFESYGDAYEGEFQFPTG